MSIVMNVIAASMHNDAEQMRLIAENIANAEVVAYRERIGVAGSSFQTLLPPGEVVGGAVTDPAALASPAQMAVAVDTRPGTLRETGEPLDVAIQGDGYFVVSTAQGELLTRRGDFHLDSTGTLCAFTGDPVLGSEGIIRIKAGTPHIGSDGTIVVDGQIIGHLQIADPAPQSTLQPVADGLFAAPGGQAPTAAAGLVRQGFLETSNVSPVNQMVALLQTTHHFEAGQRFVRAYDEMLDQALTDLGKV
jgi:flagellar basal-body rod protein FlgF